MHNLYAVFHLYVCMCIVGKWMKVYFRGLLLVNGVLNPKSSAEYYRVVVLIIQDC